nr:hypothetical protein [Vandammella animalimorsus]
MIHLSGCDHRLQPGCQVLITQQIAADDENGGSLQDLGLPEGRFTQSLLGFGRAHGGEAPVLQVEGRGREAGGLRQMPQLGIADGAFGKGMGGAAPAQQSHQIHESGLL